MKATIGVYPDLEDELYRELDAVSHSDLRKWAGHEPPPDLRALVIGSAFHAAVLLPEYAARTYATMEEDVDLRTTEGMNALKDFQERTGKTALRPKERATIRGMVTSLRDHPEASKFLKAPGEIELAVVSDLGGLNGVLSKGLIDKKCRKCLVDLKSTGCGSEEEFKDSFYKFGYYAQGAYYVDLVAAHTGEYLPLFFVCASKSTLRTWVTRLTPEQYACGRLWCMDILRLYSWTQGPALALKESLNVAK